VLQARISSTRLPAKVLLPVCDMPVVVLAAKRAANTGIPVMVVTSTDSSDDVLVKTLNDYNIQCVRGSLENTLKRFVDALSNANDDDIIIRLTGDNVFPDGLLLDEIKQVFLDKKLDYLCCNGMESGLPYGVSAEFTYLKHLRKALVSEIDANDKEHVTPFIIRQFGVRYFTKYSALKKGLYRSTIDNLDDYLCIKKVLSGLNDPVNVSVFELIERLSQLENSPISNYPLVMLILGGAQLGLNYGIANVNGKPSLGVSKSLIKMAINNGVEFIDTANAYGNSEAVIGQSLEQGWKSRVNVITKLSPLNNCPKNANKKMVYAYVEASVFQSCRFLNCQQLDVLMLHRAIHINDWNGCVLERLIQFKNENVINKIGVSVQTPDELDAVLEETLIEFIQMPFNILDGRWTAVLNKLQRIKTEREVSIHVRSVFLQGLLLSDSKAHWKKANVENNLQVIDWLQTMADKFGRNNVADLCLAYVRSQQWVDGIVVGMETTSQLIDNMHYFNNAVLACVAIDIIESQRPDLTDTVLNPVNWK